ncbi:MAG TPA: S8 family serine peptidase [Usitatibacter sp.]|nr:S8 family serine peptidase [Usitatibacter sp.]
MADHDLELVPDTSWDGLGIEPGQIDPGVRLVASLIDVRDADQLYRRTGMRLAADGTVENPDLPLFLRLAPGNRMTTLERLVQAKTTEHGYSVSLAPAFLTEARSNPRLDVVPVTFNWRQGGIELQSVQAGTDFRQGIARLLGQPGVRRASVPNPLQPSLEDSLRDMELPLDRKPHGLALTGKDVVVGIIDDGCALAHPHFLVPGTLQSRILFLWDQASQPQGAQYWTDPGNFGGRELTQANINSALAAHAVGGRVDEDAVYGALGYEVGLASHGTCVLDIAAGNGTSLMGSEGVANEADIIFVQLPGDLIAQGSPVLEDRILQGVQYVFDRAASLGKQAVVNVSFGGYSGPHDGTSGLSSGIDELLKGIPGRAVVVAAGNGFEADCHAQQDLAPGKVAKPLIWQLRPEDPTSNQMEIWYGGDARLEVILKAPGVGPLPPVGFRKWMIIKRASDNQVVGWIQHDGDGVARGSNVIRINLSSTAGEDGSRVKGLGAGLPQQSMPPPPPLAAPASSGAWTVTLRNTGQAACTFHAWIARDDVRMGSGRRRQQSRFDEANADPRSTVADLGTGQLVICVGAHNTATGETCRYSACGPTRHGKQKPDLTAPAEETASGGGVLCASSRRALPSRLSGTSAAAPQVAGLVALIMQATRAAPLTADRILARLTSGAQAAQGNPPPPARKLAGNRHQEVDAHRPPGKRQADMFAAVIGAGKVNVPESTR